MVLMYSGWLAEHLDILVLVTFLALFSRICYTDSIGIQEDQYPPNIAVKVNQSYCHVPVSYSSTLKQSTASEEKLQ